MRLTLATLDAVVGLTVAGHHAVERYEVLPTMLSVLRVTHTHRQRALVLAFIIMDEDGGDVDAIGTGHAVLTVVAGDILQTDNAVSHLAVQVVLFLFGQRLQRTVAQQVILQVLHIGHAAKHGEHTLWRTGIAEGPRGNGAFRVLLLQFAHQVLRQLYQSPAQQGFHDDGRDTELLEFGVEVAGIDVALINLVGIVPVQVVQLYLHEVPVIFVVTAQHLVEHRFLPVEREAEVADAASLTLLHQEVHHAVVHVASIELVHTAADGVQQVVVQIVHLQFFHRVVVHLNSLLTAPVVAVEVRQLRGHKVLRALMAAQGDARAAFRLSLTIDGAGVEVVHAVFDGIVHLTIDHLLVKLVFIVHLRRQAHHAIA